MSVDNHARLALYEAELLLERMRSGNTITTNEALLSQAVVNLTAENERLRDERDREADRAKYWATMAEHIGLDVARMRDARDEACDLADRLWREHAKDKNQLVAIARLRQVGRDGG